MAKDVMPRVGDGWQLPPHHSASSLGTFRACPEKYKQRYLLGAPDKENIAGMMGTAIHDAVYQYHLGVVTPRLLAPTAIRVFTKLVGAAVAAGANIELYGKPMEEEYNRRKTMIMEQCATYLEFSGADKHRVMAAEVPFELQLPGVKRPIIGRIDQVLIDPDGEIRVRDLKTGSRKMSSALQLLVYNLGAQTAGYTPSKWGSYWYGKDGKEIWCDIAGGTPDYIGRLFAQLETHVEQGLFNPLPGGDCYLCPHSGVCPEPWKPYR